MQLLEKHFDLAFSAPNGVQKLRKLILRFAVQGKLVPQDPNDEPAEFLVKRNQKLITEAMEGTRKTIPELRSTEAKIPFGWVRCQLADVALVVMGNSPPGDTYNDYGEGVPLINGPVEFSRGAFGLTLKTKYTTAPSRLCQEGDLLVCVRGATTGRTNIAAFDACIGRGVALIRGWEAQQYLNYLLWHLGQQLLEQGKGTTFPSIAYADLAGLEIWLPPLAEQRCIVAKIDRLMAQCDDLENLGGDRNQKRITIHTAAINRLLAAQETSDFSTAWDFLQQHFSELYSVKENVAELRKAILQLAVMGKLVPQDPNDEPASELLRAIEVEKQQLVKEGKIKQPKQTQQNKPKEVPYKLPRGWEWVRVIDIVDVGTGSTPTKGNSEYYDGDIPWYTSSSTNNVIAEKPETFITEKALKETNCKIFPAGSLIIALYGQGKTRGQISELVIPGATNQAIAAMVFYEASRDIKQYIKYYFVKIYDEIRALAEGAAQPNLNVGKIKDTLIPVPPSAEQHRIVAKVDQLMELCDRLEQQIDAATDKRTELLNALMAQV
jgi:type I restriction enzyme, S subunit